MVLMFFSRFFLLCWGGGVRELGMFHFHSFFFLPSSFLVLNEHCGALRGNIRPVGAIGSDSIYFNGG